MSRGAGLEHRIVGPPGTGKTTTLARQVAHDVERYGSEAVLVASLTRAAAAEIGGRELPLDRHRVGTLHAHAYRALGHPPLVVDKLKQWNAHRPDLALSGGGRSDVDEPAWDQGQEAADESPAAMPGDWPLAQMDLLRARMVPPDEWPPVVTDFAVAWGAWKQAHGYLDFTDLIEHALAGVPEAPGAPAVLIADETQDYSALEMALCRAWAERCERFYAAGDPDQCQPGDTQVLTPQGARPLADLDPAVDRIVSYDRHSQEVVGLREGYAFEKSARPYHGALLTIRAGEHVTRCTPNHRWLVRWQTRARQYNAVYLMRRGGWWRVGWCQVFNSEGSFHVGMRARLERADAIWILRLFDTKAEASAYESLVAARYGLPTLPFEPASGAQYHTTETITRVFGELGAACLAERAARCLAAHGREAAFPVWEREPAHRKQGLTRVAMVAACNLFPEVMLLPAHLGGKRMAWSAFTLAREPFTGTVYSLNVAPHHLYVADGLITHNSIYEWRGADPHVFRTPVLPPERTKVLAQSYRVPRAVHARAVDWVERIVDREPVTYRPRDAEGEVRRLPAATWKRPHALVRDIEAQLDAGREVMVLASCSYMLAPTITLLRREGIPFHNPYRKNRGDWNPLQARGTSGKARVLALLRPDEDTWGEEWRFWTAPDLRSIAGALRKKGVLVPGGQARLDALSATEDIGLDVMHSIFEEPVADRLYNLDLSLFEEFGLADKQRGLSFPLAVARARGGAALREPPRVVVGTIHSTKGGESPVVYLFPDVSQSGYGEWLSAGERRNAVVRLFYVGMTRAREELVLCGASGRGAVPL